MSKSETPRSPHFYKDNRYNIETSRRRPGTPDTPRRIITSLSGRQVSFLCQDIVQLTGSIENDRIPVLLSEISDEKQKLKYEMALKAFEGVLAQGKEICDLREVLVWENLQDSSRILEFKFHG